MTSDDATAVPPPATRLDPPRTDHERAPAPAARSVPPRTDHEPWVAAGLGLLDLDIEFADPKIARQVTGRAGDTPVHGYEIHHGRVHRTGDHAWLTIDGAPEGSVRQAIWGTHVHGLLESDDFRRHWLTEVAARAGRTGFTVAPDTSVAAIRTAQLDLLADLIEQHVDLDALDHLIRHGAPADLPVIRTETPSAR
ncbi:hypothetical protein ACFVVM_00290 [Nocardia sp. NPDC058176]|uniref:hypothetical protein n=1 Tax=Nocardia sp. NPDC058176 TaxID=3346368 RepID=UPI0036DB667E